MGDAFGNVVHFGERECSIQRRNQKVVEEAPSPGISDDVARASSMPASIGAGTAGRLPERRHRRVHGRRRRRRAAIAFLEVNTRLQVEHRVTEAVTGHDLVELQLRVAAGEPLRAHAGRRSRSSGHAIEVRLVPRIRAPDGCRRRARSQSSHAEGRSTSAVAPAASCRPSTTRCSPRSSPMPRPGRAPRAGCARDAAQFASQAIRTDRELTDRAARRTRFPRRPHDHRLPRQASRCWRRPAWCQVTSSPPSCSPSSSQTSSATVPPTA